MNSADFTAIVVANEINLNKLAEHFGLNKKIRWEDPFILKPVNLAGILTETEQKYVYIYYFGSIVFINFSHHEMVDVLKYLNKIERGINYAPPCPFQDDYKLIINPQQENSINFDDMVTDSFADYQLEIICTVLAKSVALEKIETQIDTLYDDIEDIIDNLDRGHSKISDHRLAKTSALILRFKHNSISYIMLLDKPDLVWVNEEAGKLLDHLSQLFELEDRYEAFRQKTETLMDITQVFSGLTHAERGARLEWMIIILIAIDIVLSLIDKFF